MGQINVRLCRRFPLEFDLRYLHLTHFFPPMGFTFDLNPLGHFLMQRPTRW